MAALSGLALQDKKYWGIIVPAGIAIFGIYYRKRHNLNTIEDDIILGASPSEVRCLWCCKKFVQVGGRKNSLYHSEAHRKLGLQKLKWNLQGGQRGAGIIGDTIGKLMRQLQHSGKNGYGAKGWIDATYSNYKIGSKTLHPAGIARILKIYVRDDVYTVRKEGKILIYRWKKGHCLKNWLKPKYVKYLTTNFSAEEYTRKQPPCPDCGTQLQWDNVRKARYCTACPFNTYPKKAESFEAHYRTGALHTGKKPYTKKDLKWMYNRPPDELIDIAIDSGVKCNECGDGANMFREEVIAMPYSSSAGGTTVYYNCNCGHEQVIIFSAEGEDDKQYYNDPAPVEEQIDTIREGIEHYKKESRDADEEAERAFYRGYGMTLETIVYALESVGRDRTLEEMYTQIMPGLRDMLQEARKSGSIDNVWEVKGAIEASVEMLEFLSEFPAEWAIELTAENRQPPWSATNRRPQRKMECGECNTLGYNNGQECDTCDGKGYWMIQSPQCGTCGTDIEWENGVECVTCETWYCNDHYDSDKDECLACRAAVEAGFGERAPNLMLHHAESFLADYNVCATCNKAMNWKGGRHKLNTSGSEGGAGGGKGALCDSCFTKANDSEFLKQKPAYSAEDRLAGYGIGTRLVPSGTFGITPATPEAHEKWLNEKSMTFCPLHHGTGPHNHEQDPNHPNHGVDPYLYDENGRILRQTDAEGNPLYTVPPIPNPEYEECDENCPIIEYSHADCTAMCPYEGCNQMVLPAEGCPDCDTGPLPEGIPPHKQHIPDHHDPNAHYAEDIDTYRGKRKAPTPEPGAPGTSKKGTGAPMKVQGVSVYSVQEHHAEKRGPHRDIRIGYDDATHGPVLLSFVPTGGLDNKIPTKVGRNDKITVIQTEDHPFDYWHFEGSIPSGSYGAGPVSLETYGKSNIISYEPGKKLKVEFTGGKYPGKYVFIHYRGKVWGMWRYE